MGVGRGTDHRIKSVGNVNARRQEKPMPKFNIDDQVIGGDVKYNVVGITHSKLVDTRQECYYYEVIDERSSSGTKFFDEDRLTLMGRSQRKDFRDYLHKFVTYQYRLDYERMKPGDASRPAVFDGSNLRKLDGQKAHIFGVRQRDMGSHDVVFQIWFDQATHAINERIRNHYFTKNDFYRSAPTINSEDLNALVF